VSGESVLHALPHAGNSFKLRVCHDRSKKKLYGLVWSGWSGIKKLVVDWRGERERERESVCVCVCVCVAYFGWGRGGQFIVNSWEGENENCVFVFWTIAIGKLSLLDAQNKGRGYWVLGAGGFPFLKNKNLASELGTVWKVILFVFLIIFLFVKYIKIIFYYFFKIYFWYKNIKTIQKKIKKNKSNFGKTAGETHQISCHLCVLSS